MVYAEGTEIVIGWYQNLLSTLKELHRALYLSLPLLSRPFQQATGNNIAKFRYVMLANTHKAYAKLFAFRNTRAVAFFATTGPSP